MLPSFILVFLPCAPFVMALELQALTTAGGIQPSHFFRASRASRHRTHSLNLADLFLLRTISWQNILSAHKKKSFFYNWSKNESCWSFPTFCGGSRTDRVHSAHSACLFRAGAQENTFNFVVGLTVQVKETSGFQRLPKISLYVNSLQLFIHLLVDICLSLQFPNWFACCPSQHRRGLGCWKGSGKCVPSSYFCVMAGERMICKHNSILNILCASSGHQKSTSSWTEEDLGWIYATLVPTTGYYCLINNDYSENPQLRDI